MASGLQIPGEARESSLESIFVRVVGPTRCRSNTHFWRARKIPESLVSLGRILFVSPFTLMCIPFPSIREKSFLSVSTRDHENNSDA